MQLLIDIPERLYKQAKGLVYMDCATEIEEYVAVGTPLNDIRQEIIDTIKTEVAAVIDDYIEVKEN